jgi:hypothetical protein
MNLRIIVVGEEAIFVFLFSFDKSSSDFLKVLMICWDAYQPTIPSLLSHPQNSPIAVCGYLIFGLGLFVNIGSKNSW